MPDVQITFAHDWRLFVAVLGLAVAAVVYFYLSNVQHVRGRILTALSLLRILALLVVVLLLFRPRISYERRRVDKEPMAVALDRSQSMRIRDRFTRARGVLLEQDSGILDRIARDFQPQVWTFAESAAPQENPHDLLQAEADGQATVLGALQACLGGDGDPPAGLILLTDGIDTTGRDVVPELRERGVKIYPVAVGRPLGEDDSYPDIWISDVETKRTAIVDNLTELTVYVDALSFGGRFVQVKVSEDNREVAQSMVALDDVKGAQEVKVSFAPREVGMHTYTVRIGVEDREAIAENNSYSFDLQVTEARIGVLYIAAAPGPEFKFLKRTLRSDPDLDVLSLVEISSGVFQQEGGVAGLKLRGFPTDLATLRKFDVVVLGDIDSTYFSAGQLAALKTFVGEGGGLAALWGQAGLNAGGYGETALADVLPVRLGPRDELQPFVSGAFHLQLTPAGRAHPILSGCVELFTNSAAQDAALTPLQSAHRLGRAVAGAEVLATHPQATATGSESPLPVLVAGDYGEGRVLVFSAGPTWPWSFKLRGLGRESQYHRLWGQAVRWLAREEAKQSGFEPGVAASLDRARYAPGQTVKIYAHARDQVGALTDRAHLRVEVRKRPDDAGAGTDLSDQPTIAELALGHVPGTPGRFEGTYTPPAPGAYRLTAMATMDNTELGRRDLDFRVGKPNLEFEVQDPDIAALKRLAEETGGRYTSLANVNELLDFFRESQRLRREPVVIDLWNGTILFLLFVAATTAEWMLRRKVEMA